MKTVRVENGVVREAIPEYALPPERWYGAVFASQCVEAPDEVEAGWVYNCGTKLFSKEIVESRPPTPDEQMRADIDFLAAMTGVSL